MHTFHLTSLSLHVLCCLISFVTAALLLTENEDFSEPLFLTNCLTEQSKHVNEPVQWFYVAQWGMNMALTFPRFMARLTY